MDNSLFDSNGANGAVTSAAFVSAWHKKGQIFATSGINNEFNGQMHIKLLPATRIEYGEEAPVLRCIFKASENSWLIGGDPGGVFSSLPNADENRERLMIRMNECEVRVKSIALLDITNDSGNALPNNWYATEYSYNPDIIWMANYDEDGNYLPNSLSNSYPKVYLSLIHI